MQIVIASGRLREGVSEEQLIAASDAFEEQFVHGQPGVLRRDIVRYDDGRYADIVLFRDAGAVQEVLAAEGNCAACDELMRLFDRETESFEAFAVLKTYTK